MKFPKCIWICMFLLGCTNVELVDYWKNPEYESYSPKKVLLIGLTSNVEARQQFEKQLQQEFESRGVEAVTSLSFLTTSFTSEKKTLEELKEMEDTLISDGFDTILFAKLIGSEDKIEYKTDYDGFDIMDKRFKEDYLKYQDAFYNPDYYNAYTIYHTESSLYCVCPEKDQDLIWRGFLDVTEPETISETVHDYARMLILIIEEQQLISPAIPEFVDDTEAIQ